MAKGNPHLKVREMLGHVRPLPPEAAAPIWHYRRTANDVSNAVRYFTRKSAGPTRTADFHLGQLRQMALVSLVENLERLFKEMAAACIDVLAPRTADDRLDIFQVGGGAIAGHYGEGTLGKALTEASTWLSNDPINKRFRDLLADQSSNPKPLPRFELLPEQPHADRERYATLKLLWQLRNTVVHNVGVVTPSDAVKLRVLSKQRVVPHQLLVPTADDLVHVEQFLTETAEVCNERICHRLIAVLDRIHADDPALISPPDMAQHLADVFQLTVMLAGATANPPP